MFLLLHRGDRKVGLAVAIYLKAGNVVPTEVGICCCLDVVREEGLGFFFLCHFVLWLLGRNILFHFLFYLKEANS